MLRALIPSVLCTGLIAVAPVPASAAGASDDVTIETKDLKLSGSYFSPKGKGRAPGVLLIHEAGGDRTQLESIAKSLQKKGFGVLTLDLRGHGDSQDDRFDWAACEESERAKLWQQSLRDVQEGADWLLSQRDIHSTNLSMVGFRSGCALVARHAEDDANVVGMALISPKAQDFGFDVENSILTLNGLPTVLIDVDNDETERMATEANAQSPKNPYVSLVTVRKKGSSALDDSRTASRVTSFLSDVAMPKKGRG